MNPPVRSDQKPSEGASPPGDASPSAETSRTADPATGTETSSSGEYRAESEANPSPARAAESGTDSPAAPRNLPAKKGISRTALNFWVDFGILVLLCNTMWIAGVVFFVFPAPSESAGWNVFGYDFDQWSFALLLSFSAFCLGVLVHLILHWTWILGVITSRLSRWKGERVTLNESAKTLYGVGSMIVVLTILAILIMAAEFSAHAP